MTDVGPELAAWIDAEISELFGQGGPAAVAPNPFNQGYNFKPGPIWVSLWHDIFGGSNRRPRRPNLSQAQINTIVAQTLGNLNAYIATQANALLSEIETVPYVAAWYAGQAEAAANAYATTLFWDGVEYANGLYNRAVGYSGALHQQALAYAAQLYNQGIGYSSGLFNRAVGYSQQLYNQAVGYSSALYNQAIAHSNAVGNAAVAHSDQLYATEEGQRIASVQSLTAEMAAAVNRVEQDIGSALNQAESYASVAAGAAGAAAIATVLAKLQPQISKAATELATCVDPLCDTVTPNASQLGQLGKLLKDLEGLVAAGLLAGLLTAAVEDPKDTAGVVADACGWMAPLGAELARAVGAVVNV